MKIRYIGELLDHTGYGQAARLNVALLHKLGHDIQCVPIGAKTSDDPDWKIQIVMMHIDNQMPDPDLIITHIYPPSGIQKYQQEGVPLIAYIAWETDMLPSLWTYHLNKYADVVVTTCEESAETFRKSGVQKPVHVLGPTIFDDDVSMINVTKPDIADVPRGLQPIYKPEKFIFYSVFQWIERKDPTKLVSAFIQEFDNTEDDVMLLLKTYRRDYSKEETQALIKGINTLNRELNIIYPPEVRIIPYRLSADDMMTLHRMGSCYVTPHRGEGTGLGIIDAILHERPVITTAYGGPYDFTTRDYTRWLNYQMIPIQNPLYCYNYFNAYMMWADVDIMDLRRAMRGIYEGRNDPIDPIKAKEYLLEQYGYETTSTIAADILKTL
jgi:glycosyltransferase involved in cell wall biosynthesis